MGASEILYPALALFLASLVFSLALVLSQRWHGRFTHDGTAGLQKFHKVPVPRIGGLALAASYWSVLPLLPGDLKATWLQIGIAASPALLVGLGEDLTKRVGIRARLLATMVSGMIFVALTGYSMNEVDLPGIDWLLSFSLAALLFTGFAMGGVANAINIIDGFHGLAAGSLLIMFGAFGFVAVQVGDGLTRDLALLYGALTLGFFAVNFPRGLIFLGDGGAYFLGFLLAALGVLLPERNLEISAWAAILICAYPVIETLASIRRKAKRNGHSVGRPDRVHFHMLAHRRYARRLVPDPAAGHLRNPATSLVTWTVPALTTAFVVLSYDSVVLSAAFFALTAYLYGQVYSVMSLNGGRLPLGIARLL